MTSRIGDARPAAAVFLPRRLALVRALAGASLVRAVLVRTGLFAVLLSGAACGRAPLPAERPLRTKSGFAMGTVADIKLASADSDAADAALEAAFAELARIEALATIHAPESEVSRVNRAAGSGEATPVGPDLDAILALGVKIARESDGAFDPTVGPLMRAWGFPEHPAVPAEAAIAGAKALVGWDRLARLPADLAGAASWRLADAGMSIDLGGIACGYGVDRAALPLAAVSPDFLVNVGGDILVSGSRPDGTPWTVAVQHPRDPSRFLMTLHLRGPAAVSTSGDYEHFVMQDGVRRHHVLDPKTGWPAPDLCSVTIVAPDGSLADVASKPAFVLGPERGFAWVEEHPELEGVFVRELADGSLLVRETSGIAALRGGPAGADGAAP